MTDAERQARAREKKRKAGLMQKQVWVHPAVWPAVQRFIREQNDSAAPASQKGQTDE